MKAKKTTPSRRRISFAVDRDEIEINSDWVEAVMGSAPLPSPVDPSPAPPSDPDFFVPETNTATGEDSAPDERCTPVEENAAVATLAPEENNAPVENIAPVAHSTSVAIFATDAKNESVANNATGRRARPRPILRVTDGLTPGQYAVYSLMYEVGSPAAGDGSRIYKGGYADLGRLTGLSKRGLQNIVSELQSKEILRIHQQPGYHRSETSAYLVRSVEAVLAVWHAKGWRHAVGKSKILAP